jgi:small ligand-binding sensory domain FIST
VTVWEKAALLEAAHDKEADTDQRSSVLWGELVAARREWDVAEEKVSSLATKAAVANQQQEATEEQCRRLAQELTLLSIRVSELFITMTGSSLQAPLHEGMYFAVARHAEAASQFSALQVAMSLASRSIIGHLPFDVPQAGVVGEIVSRFWKYADWCS